MMAVHLEFKKCFDTPVYPSTKSGTEGGDGGTVGEIGVNVRDDEEGVVELVLGAAEVMGDTIDAHGSASHPRVDKRHAATTCRRPAWCVPWP